MTIQSIPLSSILPPDGNPRTAIDPTGIEGLAASIQTDGLLQNLVVAQIKGRKPRYRLISGERRYRALKLLEERGVLPDDYAVPVDIRAGLSAEDSLRLATVENLQRENLTPLEEAAAFAGLMQDGASLEDLAARTGLSVSTNKRRLALTGLCDETKTALESGALTLAQAEALTLGTHEAQRDLVQRLADGFHYDADDIRNILLERRPSVALARFPLEQYQGTFTTDLFGEDDTTYFDDVEQFFTLQRQAVAEMVEAYAATAEWVEVTEHYHIPRWHYRQAEEGDAGGVVINLAPSGEVEVLDGLARHEVTASVASATADTPLAPRPKPPYSEMLCRYIAHHKSMAVQHLLLANPRKAREVAVLLLLGISDYVPSVNLSRHDCLATFARADETPASYESMDRQAKRLAAALGLAKDDEEDAGWPLLRYFYGAATALYEAVKALSDEDLDQLHLLLTTLCFGQGDINRLDTADTLFNRVARDLGADMRAYWRPDTDFLSRRTRAQLVQIVEESGLIDRMPDARGMKKGELVRTLERQFARVHDLSNPTDADLKARDWLPDAMRFPAVDPAARIDDGEEADDAETYEGALAA
jgi:ParB family chromosome partitioning protein